MSKFRPLTVVIATQPTGVVNERVERPRVWLRGCRRQRWEKSSMGKLRSRFGRSRCGPRQFIVVILFILVIPLARAQSSGALYISSPASGAQVDGSSVKIHFELMPGVSANGIPEFRVRLDRQSPVLTSDNEYILKWLSPGLHTVTVWLVDANGTPIFGARDQVQFYVP